MLIDTHAHLYLKDFRDDLDAVMDRCRQAGVGKVVLPNIDCGSLDDLRDTCGRGGDLFLPALGLHPCSVKEDWSDQLATMHALIESGQGAFAGRPLAGIGEIGLDYYWDLTFREQQHEALRVQLAWAKDYGLPAILHCRDSFNDLYELVEIANNDRLSGVFHCFTGSLEEAGKVMDLGGFYLGLGGVLTFKNSHALREVIRQVPLEFLVLETDAPYLTPVPHRGKRNESSYVAYVAQTLAGIKGMSLESVAEITTLNARRLFTRAD